MLRFSDPRTFVELIMGGDINTSLLFCSIIPLIQQGSLQEFDVPTCQPLLHRSVMKSRSMFINHQMYEDINIH